MRRFPSRLTLIAALAVGAALLGGPALASPTLAVTIDHSTRISVARSAGSVIVGNPAVADVTVVDGHTLFVSGRGYGVSEVLVLDALGRTLWQGDVVVTAPTQGQVSVYRGGQVTEMACAGTCSPSVRGGKSGGGAGGSGASSAGASGGAFNSALPAPSGAPTPRPML